jgi:hypothetical protein
MLLHEGNTKLGAAILHWGLPAGGTCPGQSPACARECYAKRGRYLFGSVSRALRRNLAAARQPNFARRMTAELRERWPRVVRVHTAGDFFSAAYVRDWVEIARACPDVTFYGYTRSWRVPQIAPALRELAALPNVYLWYSTDRDTGRPARLPPGVRVAYMQTAPDDLPRKAELLFRVHRLRRTVQKRVSLPLADAVTCPVENGATPDMTCRRCGICWRA